MYSRQPARGDSHIVRRDHDSDGREPVAALELCGLGRQQLRMPDRPLPLTRADAARFSIKYRSLADFCNGWPASSANRFLSSSSIRSLTQELLDHVGRYIKLHGNLRVR
jgi:hypothetical protein